MTPTSLPLRSISMFWVMGASAWAQDILWYTGDGGATATSLTALEGAAGTCSTGLEQTPRWPSDLLAYRLVFLSVTSDPLSTSQRTDLLAYLAEGRTLVLVGDSAWFNTPHVSSFNGLLDDLGVDSRFVEGVSLDSGCMQQAPVEAASPLTEGVKAITYAYSGALDRVGGDLLFSGESGQALVVAHDNLVLAADLNIFEGGCPMGPGNAAFFANLYRGACLEASADADGDGFISAACGGDDCDDGDADLRPDRAWYPDADGDGLGDPGGAVLSCCPIADLLENGDDCDDSDPLIGTGDLFFPDADGDGHGDPSAFVRACVAPSGTVAAEHADDCDDSDPAISPSAEEVCNGTDDTCDGLIDDDDPLLTGDLPVWYPDADGDGHGDPLVLVRACVPPAGFLSAAGDCDDSDPAISPSAEEVCNSIDDDCDGLTDEGDLCAQGEVPAPAPSPEALCGCSGRRALGVLGVGVLWGWGRRRGDLVRK